MYFSTEIASVGAVVSSLTLLGMSRNWNIAWRPALIGVCVALAAYKAFDLLRLARGSVRFPPLWDFKAFWMFGRVAASHHNVYDPASYQMYGALLNPANDLEFKTIALNIGLPYPPPGVLLVYPLGLFANLSSAMMVWYVAIFGAIAASIFLLWRRFFVAEGRAGLIVAALLVLALSSTRMVVALTQVQFFALFLLLLFWGEKNPWRAGLWLAPLIVLRPFFILLAIYLAVRRQWTALLSLAATSAVLVAISIPLLGPGGLTSYFLHPPTQRYPWTYFLGSQCLYKLLVTLNPNHDGYFSLAAYPLYGVIAVSCLVAAAYICAVRAKHQPDACLGLLVALGLWLYPSTDTHYCVLLLPAFCAVWRYRERLAVSRAAVVAFFALQYLLLNALSGVYTTGLLIAADCVFFGLLAFRPPAPLAVVEHEPLRAAASALGST